jgi:hypothetical protein
MVASSTKTYSNHFSHIESKRCRAEIDTHRLAGTVQRDDSVQRWRERERNNRQERAISREEESIAFQLHTAANHVAAPKSRPVSVAAAAVDVETAVVAMVTIRMSFAARKAHERKIARCQAHSDAAGEKEKKQRQERESQTDLFTLSHFRVPISTISTSK